MHAHSERRSPHGLRQIFVLASLGAAFAACGGAKPTAKPPPPPKAARKLETCPAASTALAAAPVAPSAARGPRPVIDRRQNESVDAISFSPDGRLVATSSAGRVVNVWDAHDRALVRTLRVPQLLPPIVVEWSAKGQELAVGQTQSLLIDADSEKVLGAFLGQYDSPTGEKLRRLPATPGRPWVGLDGNDVALFDDARKVAEKLVWPTGMTPSGAWIHRLSPSSSGGVLVGVAGSKGLFVWDLSKRGEPARNFPIDENPVDVAVAPRGNLAYVAVRPKGAASRVDVVDLATGAVTRALPLKDAGDWITTVGASPDGGAVVAGSLHEIAAWDTATGQRLWSLSADEAVVRARNDLSATVSALAFSPVDASVAIGNQRGDVYFLDTRSGAPIGELGVEVRRPHALVFSTDGRSLLALSAAHATRWSIDQGRLVAAHLAPGVAAASSIADDDFLVARSPLSLGFRLPTDPPPACPDGTPIFTAAWSDADELAALPGFPSRGLRVSGATGATGAPAPAGAKVCAPDAFSLGALDGGGGRALVRFSRLNGVVQSTLGVVQTIGRHTTMLRGSDEFLFAQSLSADGKHAAASDLHRVRVWSTVSGEREADLELPPYGTNVGVAFSPTGDRLAIVAGQSVEVRAVDGGKLAWRGELNQPLVAAQLGADGTVFVGALGGAIARVRDGNVMPPVLDGSAGGQVGVLALSPDGTLLASTHQDGSVRVWDTRSMSLRATLVDFADDEWLATTPGGAFLGTDEVGRRIGWVFEAPLERFGFEQFASKFRDETTVRCRLSTGVGDATAIPNRPPSVDVVGAPTHVGGKTIVRVHARATTRVESILGLREGRPLDTRKLGLADGDATFELPELAGDSRLAFVALDDLGFTSKPARVDVRAAAGKRPELWLVGVGVSAYPKLSKQEQLHVADADARALVAELSKQAGEGRPFAAVHAQLLVEDKATVASIQAALAGLASMGPDDLAVVFFAGHGVKLTDGSDMRFLTRDADTTPASIAAEGIGWGEIAEKLEVARGRVLVLLDACHSGHMSQDLVVPNGALATSLSRQGRAGVLVFAAAKGRQESFEDPAHGFFTQALLATLRDPTADRDGDGRLEVSELIDAVTTRVDRQTRGLQTPWVARREMFGDFQIAASK